MKTNIYFIIFFVILLGACSEDLLEKNPLDAIASNDYWKTPLDQEMFVDQFYPSFPVDLRGNGPLKDSNSDNLIETTYNERLAGTMVVPASGGGWSWTNIRSVNYFLANCKKVKSPWLSISQYIGEAYFFRAYYYFNLVQAFGDVPWINKPLKDDSEELFMARTSRSVVCDSIVADLDKAINYMKSKGDASASKSRLNREIALLFKSRVCLFEGTWEKYHAGTTFGVTGADGKKYLTLARDAAKQLIDGGLYSLYTMGNPKKSYAFLFGQDDYSNNPEVMLWYKYDITLGLSHWANSIWGLGYGVTKWLVDSYLCIDGLPISLSPLYNGDNNLINVTKNRDPRLAQTIWIPGDPINIIGKDTTIFKKPDIDQSGTYLCVTGYQLKKYSNMWGENLKLNYYQNVSGTIIFRYAEALLNYAEAKAELGEISQSDIDVTINKLRDRVGVAHLQLNNIATDPLWDFPTLSPIINEIRRERRIELACESYRLYDFFRWRAHALIVNQRPKGAKFVQSDFPSMIPGKNIYLDNNGYIDYYQTSLPLGYGFKPDRDYLLPIPSVELTLNKNLVQNPGW